MIYQYIKRYLKNNFTNVKVDFEWSELDNIKLFSHIHKRYTSDEFEKEISEVKEAFKDFFEPIGNIVFRYKEESAIKLKVFPYRVKPQDSKHLKNIIKIIHNNRKHIEYPYQGQNDQIAIMGKIRRSVNMEVFDTQESINVKELVKHAIRVALELNERDIITQLKRKYIVKIFTKNKLIKNAQEPSKREGISNRFNGYTQEQIQETYKEIFNRKGAKIEYFLKKVMQKVLTTELNFRNITNSFYENRALKIIYSAIAKELTDYLSLEEDYIFGVAGYIMRIHFQKIHEFMAINLIECIYDKDKNANNFLLYYNGNTILRDNKKYQIPSLSTEDGQQWNNASLIGICNLWMNTKRKKERYEHKIIDTDMKIDKLTEELLYIQPEKDLHEDKLAKANIMHTGANKTYKEFDAKLKYLEETSLNSNEYFEMIHKVKKSAKILDDIDKVKREAKASLRTIQDVNMSTYADLDSLKNQKNQLFHDVKIQNLNIDSKSSQMDPILQSISKVLMARTKLTE